eukprot:jgi/Orpsp1_1/1174592/evm.model.c7180000050684.1
MNVKQVILSICERSIRNCPWSGKLWIHYANAKKLNKCSNNEILDVYNKALNNQLIMNDMNNYIEVVISKIKYELNEINWNENTDNEKIEYFRNLFIEKITEIETYFNPGDPLGRIEKLWINTEFNKFNNIEKTRQLYEDFTKKIGTNTSLWLSYIKFEIQQGNISIVNQLFKSNYKRHLDNPMKFLNKWNEFNQENSNLKSFYEYQYLIEQYKQKLENDGIYNENQNDEYMYQQYYQYQQLQKYRETKQKGTSRGNDKTSNNGIKRKREYDNEKNGPNKKRKDKTKTIDEFEEKVEINDQKIEKIKEDNSDEQKINKLEKIIEDNKNNMDIEKEKKEIFEDKSKIEFKKPEKEKPWLNKNENPETVFVNKLPPTIEKSELRKIFEKYGNIKDIRLMYRSNRAFAYIDYETSEESHASLVLNDTEVKGKKIQVAISNPSLKKTEITEIKQDNKELYLSNLPFSINIEKLKEIFSK